jgi:hypothetical protein
MVATLLPELFQTEESAILHPTREAKRLGECPPATAMLAVARHAREALPKFRKLAEARGREAAEAGTTIGRVFSAVREFGVDLFLSSEKSYRGTLLGMRHGVGVVMLLGHAATVARDEELSDFCVEWLARRTQLIEDAEHELLWFAQHPEAASSRAHSRRARSAIQHEATMEETWPTPSTQSS